MFVNGALACFIAIQLLAPSISGGAGGDDIATAYVRTYMQLLSDGELLEFAKKVESSDASQVTLAKEFAEISQRKQKLASQKTVDAEVARLLEEGMDYKQAAELIRQSSERWGKIGEAL